MASTLNKSKRIRHVMCPEPTPTQTLIKRRSIHHLEFSSQSVELGRYCLAPWQLLQFLPCPDKPIHVSPCLLSPLVLSNQARLNLIVLLPHVPAKMQTINVKVAIR